MNKHRFFLVAATAEASLALVAVFLNWLFGKPLLADLHWDVSDAVVGCLACLPPFCFFLWTFKTSWSPVARINHFLEQVVLPLFKPLSVLQLLLISLLAGIGEELLFRGAIQGLLTPRIGFIPAILLASLLFGLCHSMTRAYMVVTTLIGLYLGALWILTANLLAPLLTHAVYDFAALFYFLRWRRHP